MAPAKRIGETWTLWAFACNSEGKLERIANVRRWTAGASESVSRTFTGHVYGKDDRATFAAAALDVLALNRADAGARR